MATPDLDVIKDIPGYKVILKAVLKSQIQQLVEQLANNTDEESVILTASVADGTLSHLGSDSGKSFLEEHEDIKSQFLGFCLKRHHRKKQQEKERLEAEALQQSLQQASPSHYGGPMGGPFAGRSPRFSSPRGPGPIHPVALTRASPGGAGRSPGARHEPYPMVRPKRTSLNFDPGRGPGPGPQRTPSAVKGSEQIIKIEPDDNETSNQSESGSVSQDNVPSTSQSPSHQAKSESGDKDDDARSESSTSTIPNEPPAEGLSLDSDLSNLISEQSQQQQEGRQGSEGGEMDPNVSVKLEALTESEMELEITGVEPGRPAMLQDNWDPNVSLGMNFDPTGATGSSGDGSTGYSMITVDTACHEISSKQFPFSAVQDWSDIGIDDQWIHVRAEGLNGFQCQFGDCKKLFPSRYKVRRHLLTHRKERSYQCQYCDYAAVRQDTLENHVLRKHSFLKIS